MRVVVVNLSKKKSFRKSKRIVSAVLPSITIRVNLGDVPRRVLLVLLKNLKSSASRGTQLKVFFEDNQGYHGFKCVEIGPRGVQVEPFVLARSSLDPELSMAGWLEQTPSSKVKRKTIEKSITYNFE